MRYNIERNGEDIEVDLEIWYTPGLPGTNFDPPEPPEFDVERVTRWSDGAELPNDLTDDELIAVEEAYHDGF